MAQVKHSYFFYDNNTLNKGYSKNSNNEYNHEIHCQNRTTFIESVKNKKKHQQVLNDTQNIIISLFKKINLIFLVLSLTIIFLTSLYLVNIQSVNKLYIFIVSSLVIMLIGYLINIYKMQKLTSLGLIYDQLYNSKKHDFHNN